MFSGSRLHRRLAQLGRDQAESRHPCGVSNRGASLSVVDGSRGVTTVGYGERQ